ncbi:hypothetical protein [Vibrio aerogenes]|nr:hypothetical protein [Vibrio aerogenes]
MIDVLFDHSLDAGFWDGMLSVPVDLGYLAYGYFDTDSYHERSVGKERIIRAISNGILQPRHIVRTVEIIFEIFNQYVPEKIQTQTSSHIVGAISGRVITNHLIFRNFSQRLAIQGETFFSARGGRLGAVLLIGGMAERCLYKARELRDENPEVYYALYPHYYDLLYFMLEASLSPFVEALNVYHHEGQPAFNQILRIIYDEIQRREQQQVY